MTDVTKVKISSRSREEVEKLIELFKPHNIVKRKITKPCKTPYFKAHIELKELEDAEKS